MKLIGEFIDNEYPLQKINTIRNTVRCILKENEHYIFLKISGNDIFGIRNHLETVGGGIEEGENQIEALKRECLEEIGCTIKNIVPIGLIIDTYNLLNRKTNSYFYYAEVDEWVSERHLTDFEKQFQIEVIALSEEEALVQLNPSNKIKVEKLVNQRDNKAFLTYLDTFDNKL